MPLTAQKDSSMTCYVSCDMSNYTYSLRNGILCNKVGR